MIYAHVVLDSCLLLFQHPYIIYTYTYIKTYWPAGGGRGQNPENTAQGHSGHNSICPKGGYMSQGRLTWRTRRGERSDPSLVRQVNLPNIEL